MNIIVTGASRGIGFETVKILAFNPINRIVAIARSKSDLEKLKKECVGNSVSIFPFDLVNDSINEKLIPFINKQFTSVDVLINNAGMLVNKSIQQTSDTDIENIFNINVLSIYKLTRDLIPFLSKSDSQSHIVNISSMGGMQGSAKFSGLSAYSSSKGAVSILTECLAEELKQFNISVNCLALGGVQTEMLKEAFPGYQAAFTPIQMAEFVASFALNGYKHFNGKILPVSIATP